MVVGEGAMLKIIICDDNVPVCGQLTALLEAIGRELGGERLEAKNILFAIGTPMLYD